jgi:hypothetical protein
MKPLSRELANIAMRLEDRWIDQITALEPPLPGKLTPLQSDHFSPGGLMEQSHASLQRGRQN